MKKTEKNLSLLYVLFVTFLVTANAMASKVFNTGLHLPGGAQITLTVGAICYPFTFLITDIIGEVWGKKESQKAVVFGFICQIVSTIFIIIARYLPAVDGGVQDAYVTMLGQNWVFVVASLTAFLCSQSWDVFIFHKIRSAVIKKTGNNKARWIWNNASTMTSQLIDSVIYVAIAFGLGFGWFFNKDMHSTLFAMIVGQYVVKLVIAALDTPFFYIFTGKKND